VRTREKVKCTKQDNKQLEPYSTAETGGILCSFLNFAESTALCLEVLKMKINIEIPSDQLALYRGLAGYNNQAFDRWVLDALKFTAIGQLSSAVEVMEQNEEGAS